MIIQPIDLIMPGGDIGPFSRGLYNPRAACDLAEALDKCSLLMAENPTGRGAYASMLRNSREECEAVLGKIKVVDGDPTESVVRPSQGDLINAAVALLYAASLDIDTPEPAASTLFLLAELSMLTRDHVEAAENE